MFCSLPKKILKQYANILHTHTRAHTHSHIRSLSACVCEYVYCSIKKNLESTNEQIQRLGKDEASFAKLFFMFLFVVVCCIFVVHIFRYFLLLLLLLRELENREHAFHCLYVVLFYGADVDGDVVVIVGFILFLSSRFVPAVFASIVYVRNYVKYFGV